MFFLKERIHQTNYYIKKISAKIIGSEASSLHSNDFEHGGTNENKYRSQRNCDYLGLNANKEFKKVLLNYSEVLEGKDIILEDVVYSGNVCKYNSWGALQKRVLVVTNKAIYNVLPGNYSKCKRRIDLNLIGSITCSQLSEEFVLHVPSEYDYHFLTKDKVKIIKLVKAAYFRSKESSLSYLLKLEA
eukprot:snap_masked-scaffold_6-processed-gene-18.28-mRNA-1 protein AED:0.36 eAED:0.66 QI:0/0/0/1/1/1/2/0/186